MEAYGTAALVYVTGVLMRRLAPYASRIALVRKLLAREGGLKL